ncbi:UNKNOWN [Stylonychia lemnae]|uniref:Uncharacterized protein n=1 Tax=Stylonychia lemnae TaxID=5949 RepID=A0A078A2K2_STYLE|nr:UNKNOWN [Stylonychia lemnae]|eukprot:CDW76441.1 UNKNOWN [Stylonychia lemnae]
MKGNIDRTPNGTQISSEDPMKIKLRKIAESKLTVPSPELIIRKMQEKLDKRLIETSTIINNKAIVIRQDSESHFQTKKLSFLQNQYKMKQSQDQQQQQSKGILSIHPSFYDQIPYYRKIMKIPMTKLKHELESLQIQTPENNTRDQNNDIKHINYNSISNGMKPSLKNSTSQQSLKLPAILDQDQKGFLPPISSSIVQKVSAEENVTKSMKASFSMSQISTNFAGKSQQQSLTYNYYNSNQSNNHHLQSQLNGQSRNQTQQSVDLQVSGMHINGSNFMTGEPNSQNNSFELNQSSSVKKNNRQSSITGIIKPMNKRNYSQETSLNRLKDQTMAIVQSQPKLLISNGKMPQIAPSSTKEIQYLSLDVPLRVKIQRKKANQALIKWNEQRKQRQHNSLAALQNEDSKLDIVNDCMKINIKNEKSFLDESTFKKEAKKIQSVANIFKTLNL